ncbi:Predicted arabinose efflux permease, MFS family [Sphingobium sp. AP50]|uniref:spinster family MFS transporter n=1 Tax=Sphingobium sp. AP50 TaxID=1884369 RepID=UPI0008CF1E3B|nr:MFS transporter [Sphingobium sp. AP50]SEJ90465.1 Predicted arabinose efflux permease, MFS family [Sphingobium sp. AP50]
MQQAAGTNRPRAALILMTLIYGANFMDRQVLSVLAEPIKHDLLLSDTQIGLLGGFVFALFYSVFGVPVAYLADRASRVRILTAACTVWSVCCAACGLATNFAHLAMARIGVGLGEAGGVPPSYSLISDMFPAERRTRALAIFSLGIPIGLGLGSALAGWSSSILGWRASMLIVGLPGLVLAAAFFLLVKEPVRGGFDTGRAADRPSLWSCVKTFYGTPRIAVPALACAFGAFANLSIMGWFSAYLIRVLGMRLDQIGTYLSITIVIGMGLGNLASGWLIDRLAKRDPRAYVLVPAGAFALAIPFFIAGLEAQHWQTALPLIGIALGISQGYLAAAAALVQNELPSTQRSTGGALLLLVVNLIGLGGGPVFVGMISDWAAPVYGTGALRIGLYGLVPFMVLAVVFNLISARLIRRSKSRSRTEAVAVAS